MRYSPSFFVPSHREPSRSAKIAWTPTAEPSKPGTEYGLHLHAEKRCNPPFRPGMFATAQTVCEGPDATTSVSSKPSLLKYIAQADPGLHRQRCRDPIQKFPA